MHIKKTRQQCLAGSIDVQSILWSVGSRRWTDHGHAVAIDNDRLVFTNGGTFGIEEADMLHHDRMLRGLSQFTRQTGVSSVLRRAVEGIELIVRAFPSLSEHGEPLTRRPEEVQVVIEPDSLTHLLQLATRVGRNLLIPNKAMPASAKS